MLGGPYIPEIIPEEDRRVLLEKYHSGVFRRVGFGKAPALIIVDMTNAFVTDEYPTGFSKTGIPCVELIKRLADFCRGIEIPVIYTRGIALTPANYAVESGRWSDKISMVPKENHERANTIYHEISPVEGDIVIEKAKPSAFFGTRLSSILNFLGIDTLIVTGMTTSGCVRATVVDAFSYNYRVIIPHECVADRSQVSNEVSLFDMDMKYADVMKIDDVIESLKKNKWKQ